MIVDKCPCTILGKGVYCRDTVFDASKAVAFRTYPETSVRSSSHAGNFKTGEWAVITNHTLVAGTIPDASTISLCNSGDVTIMCGAETVYVFSGVGDTALLCTNPHQVCVVNIYTLNTYLFFRLFFLIDVSWLNIFYLVSVHVVAQKPELVGSNPYVTAAVTGHSIDVTVNSNACHSEAFTYRSVPGVCAFVIFEESSLTIEPDVIHLISESLKRLAFTQFPIVYLVCPPNGVLLMHNITTYHSAIIIDDYCSVFTFANRTNKTLRYSVCIIGISEFVTCLLLHVVAYNAFVWYCAPKVLVAVNKHDTRDGLNTHACKILLHVTLKTLCLRMIDTISGGCLYKQVTVEGLLNGVNVTVRQRVTVLRVTLKVLKHITVVSV